MKPARGPEADQALQSLDGDVEKIVENKEQRPKVLIAEDELLVAADLRETLENLGYDVVGEAETGPAAIEMAEQFQPDVVLMDIRLRESMDGIEAAGAIRRRWQLPVVFLTSNPNERIRSRAQAAAAYGYLLKPFRPDILNATLLQAIAQHRSARDLFTKDTWLRTVLDSLNDGIIATDREGRVRYMNPSAKELTGCASEEAIGTEIEQLYKLRTVTGETVEKCPLRKALDSALPAGNEHFLLTRQCGETVIIEDAASPIAVGEQVVGAVAIIRDITERVTHERLQEEERDRLKEQMHQADYDLGQTRAELRALSGRLITAHEDERRRLARELHDDFGQRMAILSMQADRAFAKIHLDPQEAADLLHSIREQAANLNQGLREISHRLHPSLLEDLGLIPGLRNLIDSYRAEGAEISFGLPSEIPHPSLDVTVALYRIAQEALRNATKYAPGAPIHLHLGIQNGALRLTIRDNGPGFNTVQARLSGGLGLLSMHERARLVNGSVTFNSKPGEGTVVTVSVPS